MSVEFAPSKFGITEIFAACDWFIEITKARFDEIRRVREKVLLGLYLEEKFDMALENYAELERELLGIALRESLFDEPQSDTADRRLANRRLMNLLTTVRAGWGCALQMKVSSPSRGSAAGH
jgi:hypothetical protein